MDTLAKSSSVGSVQRKVTLPLPASPEKFRHFGRRCHIVRIDGNGDTRGRNDAPSSIARRIYRRQGERISLAVYQPRDQGGLYALSDENRSFPLRIGNLYMVEIVLCRIGPIQRYLSVSDNRIQGGNRRRGNRIGFLENFLFATCCK